MSEKRENQDRIPGLDLDEDVQIQDCKTPTCIARHLSNTIMLAKAHTPFSKLFILGFLAGIYVGFGGEIAAVVNQQSASILGFGVIKVISGALFSIALILILIAGGELFTGNTLMLLSVLERRTTIKLLLRNWAIVYSSNFVGAIFIVFLLYLSGLWTDNNMISAALGLKVAVAKTHLTLLEAFIRGILANWLVCLAIWMSMASRQVIGKVVVMVPPIIIFAACGYEHCIANMYMITKGLFLKTLPEVVNTSGLSPDMLNSLSVQSFIFNNLIPVTLGNIFGAVIFVACLYWFVFLKGREVEG